MKQKNYKNEVMTFAGCTDVNAVDQPPSRHHELVSGSIHLIKNHDEAMNKTLSIGQSVNNLQSLKIDSDFRQNDVKAAAFTLAEVLISLGIIGIVAAMTIPTLIAKYQEKAIISKLKKVYSTVSQGYLYAVQEYGQPGLWDIGARDAITESDDEETYYASTASMILDRLFKNARILKTCNSVKTQSDCSVSDTHYNMDGYINKEFTVSAGKFASILLSDGTTIILMSISEGARYRGPGILSTVYALVIVDTNGELAPNTVGKDTFYFYLCDGGIVPAGTGDDVYYPFSTCYTNGGGCTAWVIENSNMDYLHCDGLSWNGKYKCSD